MTLDWTQHRAHGGDIDDFATVLEEDGVRAALAYLNRRVPHRFTAAYRFDAPTLRSVVMYDRENPTLTIGDDAVLLETYCSIIGSTDAPFHTEDTLEDPRLGDHPARESVQSYCGAPLRNGGDGVPLGSLCHFDLVPRELPVGEAAFLTTVAPLMAEALGDRLAVR